MKVHLDAEKSQEASVEQAKQQILSTLDREVPHWVDKLSTRPGNFYSIEREIHLVFKSLSDRIVAGVLAQASATQEFDRQVKK